MSDTLSQDQIDFMILDRLTYLDRTTVENIPICPTCKAGTRRMLFGSNFPTRVRIVSEASRSILNGRIPANGIFCFSCGSFYDWVDRTPIRKQP